jgi:hypothetical protein
MSTSWIAGSARIYACKLGARQANDCSRSRAHCRPRMPALPASPDEFISGAMNGDDVARVGWIVFDLVTQLGDVHVNGAR